MKAYLNNNLPKDNKKALLIHQSEFNNLKDFKEELKNIRENNNTILITPRTLEKLKEGINTAKQKFDIVLVQGTSNKANRYIVEQTNADFLLNPQSSDSVKRYDFIHHFNSGLNHILASLAKKKDIGIFISLNFLKWENPVRISKELGRINQNLILAQKYGLPIVADFLIEENFDIKTNTELKGIYHFFNISNYTRKRMLYQLEESHCKNIFKKSPNYIGEGIEVID